MKFFKSAVLLFLLPQVVFSQPHNAEILSNTTTISVEDEKLTTKQSYKIIINKRAEESRFTDIEIIYQAKEKISEVEGWIEDADGNILRRLQDKDMERSKAYNGVTFYDDYMSLKFSLRHNIYPYTIRYSYTKTEYNYFIITDWSPVFSYDIPTREAFLQITFPKDFVFKSELYGIESPEIENVKGTTTYKWKASYLNPFRKEAFSPPLINYSPRVKIVPAHFLYGVEGSFDSWSSYGLWYSNLQNGLDVLSPLDTYTISNMVKGVTSVREKTRILYHYLQDNTRYINVFTDIGGFQTMPAKYVSENKYGDCKALVNYMKSILAVAEVKSFPAIIYASHNPIDVDKGLPFPNFNHVILLVPDGNDTIWLECTNSALPFDLLGSSTMKRKALVIDSEKSSFVKTTTPLFNDIETVRTFNFKVNSLGILDLSARFLFRGDDFENFLGIQSNLDPKQQKALLNDYFAYYELEIENYELSRESRDAKEITLSLKGNAARFIKKVENEYMIIPVTFRIPDLEAPAKRKLPVKIVLPMAGRDTVSIEMTSALYIRSLPQQVDFNNEYGYYRLNVINNGNKIMLIKEFGINSGNYTIEKYPEFYSFISSLKKFEKKCIVAVSNSPMK